MTWSASPCSSTTRARPSTVPARAAPARISLTRARLRPSSASRITCSITRTRFRNKVIDAFAQSYAEGETPIPCVTCNQQIKFVDLFDMARDLGADVLATGHYISSRADGEERALFRALDADRDQSYFLFATTREQLRLLRFPSAK